MSIAENISEILENIPLDVTLVAVSKTKPVADLMQAYEAGQRDFGENKIQEMAEKAEQMPSDVRWHFIGHVQTNKIKYMAPFVHLVHGVDREKVLKELNKEAAKCKRTINCLLQVHIATEESKFGFSKDELLSLIKENLAEKYPNVCVCGLMGMATYTDNEEQIRKEFSGLKSLYDQAKELFIHNLQPVTFNTLSMGMSGDYALAIAEGSTMVRVGTAIFGERNYQ